MSEVSLIIFTDLDGSLLDHRTYSFSAAAEGLDAARRAGVPVILCSSKTRAEIEAIQQAMLGQLAVSTTGPGSLHPFITENGSALVVPDGYFPFPLPVTKRLGNYRIVEFGLPYDEVVARVRRASARAGVQIVGFADMSSEEVAAECGCTLEQARLARQREYDEPFRMVSANSSSRLRLLRALYEEGLRCTRGSRFQHAMGPTDKGTAAALLKRLYEINPPRRVVTIALGDSLNDLSLLSVVDVPVIVRNTAADVSRLKKQLPGAYVTELRGPAGWARAVSHLIGALADNAREVAR